MVSRDYLRRMCNNGADWCCVVTATASYRSNSLRNPADNPRFLVITNRYQNAVAYCRDLPVVGHPMRLVFPDLRLTGVVEVIDVDHRWSAKCRWCLENRTFI